MYTSYLLQSQKRQKTALARARTEEFDCTLGHQAEGLGLSSRVLLELLILSCTQL